LFSLLFLISLLQSNTLTADSDAQQLHRYISATYNHAGGNLEEARKWYETIFKDENAPINAYKGYLSFLKDTGNFKQITQLIPKLETNKAIFEDPAVQLIIIQALEKTGNQKEAIERLVKENDRHKGHQELAFYTANLYLRKKELKSALIVIDNFLENCSHRPNNFVFYYLKAQILVQLNELDKASEQIKQCLEMHPSFDKGWLFYGMLEEKREMLDKAMNAYLTYLELSGGNKEVERHLLQLLFKQKMMSQQNKTISIDAVTLKKAILLFEQKRYHEALEYLREHLDRQLNKTNASNKPSVQFELNTYKKELKLVEQKLKKILYIDEEILATPICILTP